MWTSECHPSMPSMEMAGSGRGVRRCCWPTQEHQGSACWQQNGSFFFFNGAFILGFISNSDSRKHSADIQLKTRVWLNWQIFPNFVKCKYIIPMINYFGLTLLLFPSQSKLDRLKGTRKLCSQFRLSAKLWWDELWRKYQQYRAGTCWDSKRSRPSDNGCMFISQGS